MAVAPINGYYLVEPQLHSDRKVEELRRHVKKSGTNLLIPELKPDSKTTFEGIPNFGVIRFVPADADPDLQVGMLVVFNEPKPLGFKHEGKTLFPLKADQILAGLLESN